MTTDHLRPQYWHGWSAAERTAWQEVRTALEDWDAALAAAPAEHTRALDMAAVDLANAQEDLLAARLRRLLPGSADVIRWAQDDEVWSTHVTDAAKPASTARPTRQRRCPTCQTVWGHTAQYRRSRVLLGAALAACLGAACGRLLAVWR